MLRENVREENKAQQVLETKRRKEERLQKQKEKKREQGRKILRQTRKRVESSSAGPSEVQCDDSSDDDTAIPESAECECSFCYGTYCDDRQDWGQCGCDSWVHEHCIEDSIRQEWKGTFLSE